MRIEICVNLFVIKIKQILINFMRIQEILFGSIFLDIMIPNMRIACFWINLQILAILASH